MVVARVDELHPFALTVGNSDELPIGDDSDALRLAKPRQALEVTVALEIHHFDRVVPQRRDIEPLRRDVGRKMIDASLDARKLNRADEGERRLARCGLKGHNCERCERQHEAHDYSLPEFNTTFAAPTSTSSANRSPLARSSAVPCFQTLMNIDSGCSVTVCLRMDVTVKSRLRSALRTRWSSSGFTITSACVHARSFVPKMTMDVLMPISRPIGVPLTTAMRPIAAR